MLTYTPKEYRVSHMLVPQKFLFQLLIAAVGFGSVTCPCPVAAASEMDSHDQHQSHPQSSVPSEGSQHSECVTECSLVSADSSDQDAIPCNGKYQIDDYEAVPSELNAPCQPDRFRAWIDPPTHLRLVHDTPVRRFDRLLD